MRHSRQSHRYGLTLVTVLLAGTGAATLQAANPCEPMVVTASDRQGGDFFGIDVDLDGDTMIVGADREDSRGSDAGAAYIFRWNGSAWVEEAKLLASDGAAGDAFGCQVAISGDTAVVGAPFEDGGPNSRGAAYVYRRLGSTWMQTQKLLASDSASGDSFGSAVDIDCNTMLIGAYGDNFSPDFNQGSIYVFTFDGETWSEQQKLSASDMSSGAEFGYSVELDGDTAVIGAYRDEIATGLNEGSAYVFVRNGCLWTQQAKLIASTPQDLAEFGRRVTVSGDTVAVGARREDGPLGSDQGFVYVYVRSGTNWSLQQKLAATHPDASGSDSFGFDVSLSGDSLMIGTPVHDGAAGFTQGAAYIFVREGTTWTEQAQLLAPDAGPSFVFGGAVALQGDRAVGGAATADVDGLDSAGSTSVFRRVGSRWASFDVRLLAAELDEFAGLEDSCAIEGNRAVFCLPNESGPGGELQGAAYAYVREGNDWVFLQKIMAPDGNESDQFGIGIAMDGDYLLISATGDDSDDGKVPNPGSVYVYVWTGSQWSFQTRLIASDTPFNARFGWPLDLDGDTVAMGAHDDDNARGAVYIFRRFGSIWTEEAKLIASERGSGDEFGRTLDLDGDRLIVGAWQYDRSAFGGFDHGTAFIFDRTGTTWTESAQLFPSVSESGANFGRDVGLVGDTAFVGAREESIGGITIEGGIYQFQLTPSGWLQERRIGNSNPGQTIGLGAPIKCEDGLLLAGCVTSGSVPSAVQVYRDVRGYWANAGFFRSREARPGDRFGFTLALDDGLAALMEVPREGGMLSSSLVHIDTRCLPEHVESRATQQHFGSIQAAVNAAAPGESLYATAASFMDPAGFNLQGKPLSINSIDGVVQSEIGTFTLADGTSIVANSGNGIDLHGATTIPNSAFVTCRGESVRLFESGSLSVLTGGSLDVLSPSTSFEGSIDLFQNAVLRLDEHGGRLCGDTLLLPGAAIDAAGAVLMNGEMLFASSFFIAPSLEIGCAGTFIGDGDLFCDLTNHGNMQFVDDSLIVGDLVNGPSGTITVQIGTVSLLGSLVNNGAIAGDFVPLALRGAGSSGTQFGDGFRIAGHYIAGRDASMLLAEPVWRMTLEGNFDVAIDEPSRFDLAQAELVFTGPGTRTMEMMSTDIGASESGLDPDQPGSYPIGSIRIAGGTVQLIDQHDNDGSGQGVAEAIYVSELIVEAGAVLETSARPVYYETLVLVGEVDEMDNLVPIAPPLCPGDADGNRQVNFIDLNIVLGNFQQTGAPGIPGDLNNDGIVNFLDLNIVLGNFQQVCS